MSNAVTDNTALNRYELITEGGVAFVRYRTAPGIRTLTHAEVPKALEVHGLGSALAQGTLELARTQGYRIVPQCPFIVDFIEKHPEFRDLVAR
jgi:predicted GNAT family acetyltransferase